MMQSLSLYSIIDCFNFCQRLLFVYDSYDVDRGFQVSGRHCQCHRRQDRRDVVD